MGKLSGPRTQPRISRSIKRCRICLNPMGKPHGSPMCGANANNRKP